MRVSIIFIFIILISGCKKTGCLTGDCDNGYGIYLYDNGGSDEGYWKDKKLNGYGVRKYGIGEFEGDLYKGDFKNGIQEGSGVYYFKKDDVKIFGLSKNGKLNGPCKVIFGENSNWEGSYTGNWVNGVNKEFELFLRESKDGKTVIFTATQFYDTINHYYNSSVKEINSLIEQVKGIYDKDLNKEKVHFDEVKEFVDSLGSIQSSLSFNLGMINSFEEFDKNIKYKKTTFEYLNSFLIGIDNELLNWVLLIQHNPDEFKTLRIHECIYPLIEELNAKDQVWLEAKKMFVDKY